MREAAARLLLEQGRPAEALDELTAPVDYPEVRNPAWAPWRGLQARALAALGRTDEAVALARRGGRPAAALGCALGARAVPAAARRAARRRRAPRTSARPSRCCRARAPSWRWLAPSSRSDAPPGSPTARRCRCCRRRSHTARACGARAVVRDAVAALAQRGESTADGGRRTRPDHQPAAAGHRPGRDRAGRQRGRPTTVPDPGTVRAVLESAPGAATVTAPTGASRPGLKSASSRPCHAGTPRS